MAQTVAVVQTTAAGSGVGVAVDQVGTTYFQQVKLIAGQSGVSAPIDATTGTVAAGSMGMVVALKDGASVTAGVSGVVGVSGTVPVSGTLSVSGAVLISPTTFTVNTAATVAGASVTIQEGVSVTARVSGTVTVNTAATVAGASVTIQQGASVSVSVVNTVVTQLGTAVVTLATGGTIASVLGTVNVNLAAAGTTIPVNVVAGGAAPGTTVTTQTSLTAQLMWLAPTQTLGAVSTINTILGTQIVSVVPGLSVNLSNFGSVVATTTASGLSGVTALPVWVANPTTVTVTIAGTTTGTVSILNVAPVTTAASVSVTGLPMWLSPTQGVNVSTVSGTLNVNLAAAGTTIPVNVVAGGAAPGTTVTTQTAITAQLQWFAATQTMALVSTVATVLGTVNVNVVAGGSQTTVVSGTVTVNTAATVAGASVTIQQGASVAVAVSITGTTAGAGQALQGSTASVASGVFGAIVRVADSAAVSGTVSVLTGTVNVATGTVNVGTITTQLGTQIVTLATGGTIATLLGTLPVTGTIQNVASISTVLGTQIVTLATGGTVAVLDVGRTNVLITVVSTSVGISGTTMPFGLHVGQSVPVSGTTSWVVPAGKTFRILAVNIIAQNSVTTAPATVRFLVLASTALPTWTSTVPVAARVAVQAVSATVCYSGCAVQVADIPAGVTVGLAFTIGTSGASIADAQIAGYLFP